MNKDRSGELEQFYVRTWTSSSPWLAHPKKTETIAKGKIKTDSIDARTLANLLRAGMIPESYIPPKEVRELRDLVRMRTSLVRDRTRFEARVRAELEKNRVKVDSDEDIFTIKGEGVAPGAGDLHRRSVPPRYRHPGRAH